MSDDAFTLYDLRIEVPRGERPMICNHREGDWFALPASSTVRTARPCGQCWRKSRDQPAKSTPLERDKGSRHARIMKTNLNRS
jgi:hypothetical protein